MHTPASSSRSHQRGFTLIELMIAVAIVAIIAAVALPNYRDSIRKSRRSEAINAINAVQQAQERQRARFPTYCSDLSAAPSTSACGLNVPGSTSSGYYSLAVTVPSDDSAGYQYEVVATATGSQADDTKCAKMGAQVVRGALKYGSSTSTIDWSAANPDPNRCWAK